MYTDGGARGNPGPAGIGVVLMDADGTVVGEIARGIGRTTNNVAEYTAMIEGLKLALDKGFEGIDVYSDSKLVVMQLGGDWKIKNEGLRGLAVEARRLLNRFRDFQLSHVPREQNAEADRLANQGMDVAALDEGEPPDQTTFFT
ncbi:MAG: reverse transcriptase-like protein [Actinobacteria bacterium]|nr:reverse transcriptase-like protein [Actinomycetota bacterium]